MTLRYPHDPSQKLDALVLMLVEPAKSVIANCRMISEPAVALAAAWETLHGVYGYTATNVTSQLANISNKGAVELSESGFRELVTDLNTCQAKKAIHKAQALDNESCLCTFVKWLPLSLQGEIAMKIADVDPLNMFTFALLLWFIHSRLILASSGAAALVRGMKTNVIPTQLCRDNKRSVVHNSSMAEDAPS